MVGTLARVEANTHIIASEPGKCGHTIGIKHN